MKREEKAKTLIVFSMLLAVLLISLASAGVFGWIKQTITGKATTVPFNLNISVGGLQIITIYNQTTAITINEAPATSEVILNFSVYSPVGAQEINTSSAQINISFTGEDLRLNDTCKLADYSGDYANFTCNVTMWWWDINDTWTITAYIEDNSSNPYVNDSQVQDVGEQQSVQGSPAILNWPGISPGAWNSTASNDPLLLNNTGNIPSINISVNATHLRGEQDPTQGLWAGNFSVSWDNGGSPPAECGSTRMQYNTFMQLATANLTKGNYTINNGNTGQEELYFCLVILENNLTTQAYSSANESAWIVDTLS
jgi:hypothetical protein